MQFTRLRLVGFKSFVDATELPIEPGLTGIVGPNGCGKSNLVEALRWVMGESSAKRMRGAEMDDVIFGGTAGRPARNVAEVTLVLDNAARTAPSGFNDWDELEVVRRIGRGMGSDYRINGRAARARDVQILFADNGSGANSPALVSQGRVGALINAKPGERRSILEEAAGIGGLHARRNEAEQRLRAAEQNLTRLDDVAREMDGQIRSLRTQARQASRYRNLSEQIREAEARLLHRRWRAAAAEVESAQAAFAAADASVAERMLAVAAASRAQAEAAAALPDIRRRDTDAAAELQRLLVARDALDGEEARVAELLAAARRRAAQADEDLRRERSLATDATEALARLEAEAARLRDAQAGEAPALEAARRALDEARAAVEALDADLARRTGEVAAEEARAAALSRQAADLDARRAALARRLDETRAQRAAAEREGVAPDALARAEAAVADAASELDAAQIAADTAAQAKTTAEAVLSAARDGAQAAESARARLRAEESALASLLRAQAPGGGTPALDAVHVRSGYEAALAVALGDDLSLPLGGDAPARWQVLPPYADAPPLPEGASPLSDYVEAPPALSRRLAATGVVPNEATADRLAPELRPGQMLVTADGTARRWDGVAVAAGAPSAAAVRLQQRNRLDALRAELERAEAAAAGADAALAAAKESAARATDDERRCRESVRAAFAAANAARDRHAALSRTAAGAASRLAALADSAVRLEADAADLERQRQSLDAERAALPDIEAARRGLAERRAALAERRTAQAEAQNRLDRLQREQGGRRHRLEALVAEQRSWRTRAEGAGGRLADLSERARAAQAEIQTLSGRPAEIAAERSDLLDRTAASETARRRAADLLAEAEATQAQADRALRQAESQLSEARETRARAEGAVTATRQALQTAAAQIVERFELAPERLAGAVGLDLSDGADDGIEERMARLTREREAMGPVNLRAEQELAEIETRMTTLQTERADLEAAIARLRQGIGSLNREARERLLKAFDMVDTHFQRLFVRLFGGGRAHLRLTEAEDPLDAGLEIFASPPGKKLQVLSLLSGGEQALTALALIFAVFLTNPAPICVLDEVDAPLDEANVDRFCSMVEEIAREAATRFLIITHHRLTMARVDRLFGVTMVERGVSRLVSVDLREADELRATA